MFERKTYLAQRINLRTEPNPLKKGIDEVFSFDYMGSAEFEFGALPQALDYLRLLQEDLVFEEITVELDYKQCDESAKKLIELSGSKTFKAFFVGDLNRIEMAKEFLKQELQEYISGKTKEISYILQSWLCCFYANEKAKFKAKERKAQKRALVKLDCLKYDLFMAKDYVGWWDIENHFVLFKDEDIARLWLSKI